MFRRLLLPTAALVCLITGVQANAQAVDQDVRCVVLANVFIKTETDPIKKQLSFATSVYFLGRVDARYSVQQIKSMLPGIEKTLNKANAGPLMTACARQLQAREQSLAAPRQTPPTPQKK